MNYCVRHEPHELAARGVTFSQFQHLRHLWDDNGLTQAELSRRIGIETPSSTSVLDSLDKAGLVRRERQPAFRRWLLASLCLGLGFVMIQVPAMAGLLAQHRELRKAGLGIYGLVFVLILVHALHVVGGIVVLARLWLRGRKNIYDHEHFQPVRYAAMYWHFLDAIWIVMFLMFLFTA